MSGSTLRMVVKAPGMRAIQGEARPDLPGLTLNYRRSQGKQTLGQPFLWPEVLVSREIVVGDVG